MKSFLSILAFSFVFNFTVLAQSNDNNFDSKTSIMVPVNHEMEYVDLALPQYRKTNNIKSVLTSLITDVIIYKALSNQVEHNTLEANTFGRNDNPFPNKYLNQKSCKDTYVFRNNVAEYKMVFGKR